MAFTTTRPPSNGNNKQIELITTTTTGERLKLECFLHTTGLSTLTSNSFQSTTKCLKADTTEQVKPTLTLAMTINGFQFDCFDDDGNCKDFCKFDVLDLLELLMLEQSGVAVYLPSDIAITTTTSSTFSFFIAPGPGPLKNRVSTASDNCSHLNDQQMPVNNDHTTHHHRNKKNDTSKTSTKKQQLMTRWL